MSEHQRVEYIIEPDQDWKVDLFREEDAEGVCRLFLSVYGKEYPIKTYIDPERLIKENRERRVISSVARTSKGDIVGHNALFNSAPYSGIYESGAGLVHKSYRGGQGIFSKLFEHGIEVATKLFNIELVYGEPVCRHIISQKLVHNRNMITMAFEIDLIPAEVYSKEGGGRHRVSTMLCFRTFKPKRHTVFIPEIYKENAIFLYSEFDDMRDISFSEVMPPPKSAKTKIEEQYFDFAQVARIAIWDMGRDFEREFGIVEDKVLKRGAKVIQAWCNLTYPWIGWGIEILRKRGYFFGGLLPRWFDTDGLLMQRLLDFPNWDSIKIYHERDKRLLSMVKREWEEIYKNRSP